MNINGKDPPFTCHDWVAGGRPYCDNPFTLNSTLEAFEEQSFFECASLEQGLPLQ